MDRRHFLLSTLGAALLAPPTSAASLQIVVYKSPTCGCCSAWIEHIAQAGFSIDARNVEQEELWSIKAGAGITPELGSCHTAFIDEYFVEGHVPAADVLRLLSERPEALGLSVPGMPVGSPGMEMGNQREPYVTLLVRQGGDKVVFQKHA